MVMVRTQIYLIDRHLLAKGTSAELAPEAMFTFVGIGESGDPDVAERHDEYLAGVFRGRRRAIGDRRARPAGA